MKYPSIPIGRRNLVAILLLLFIQASLLAGSDGDDGNVSHQATPLPPDKDSLSFHLPDVVVTAIQSPVPGSTSLLPATAIEHVQPISAADLIQLLPGGLTGNSGFGTPQYFTVREISFNNGGNRTGSSIAEGLQIVLDGSPLHRNADIGSPYDGMDTRFLSMNEVQQAEVIRGIPSAQYGNLTNGLLKLKTRTGYMPLTVGIRYTPSLKQYTAGKGFRISPLGHTLNLLADYTAQDKFHTGGFRIANQYRWQPGGTPLLLNLSYTGRFGGEKLFVSDEKHSSQQRQQHRLTLGSEWQPGRRLLQSLSLRIDLSATKSKLDEYAANSSQRQIATDATSNGEWIASVFNGSYYYNQSTEGLPLYAEAEAIASTRLPLRLTGKSGDNREGSVELKAGLSWRAEGNRGDGLLFDPRYPPKASLRTRSYRETPFLHNTSLFAEALFRLPRLTLQAGMRLAGLKSRDYALMSSAEPRVNLNWTVFSNARYQLQLKGGAGWMGYMPTVDRLYPGPTYNDQMSFYYNDTEGGHSLALVTVHAPGEVKNRELRPTINRKLEGGFLLQTPIVRLDMTAFFERQTGGFGTVNDYLPFAYKEYDYMQASGLRPEYRNGQIYIGNEAVPYRDVQTFTRIFLPLNMTESRKHGIEMTADFGTFQPLRTSLVIDGRWLRIRRGSTALYAYQSNYETDNGPYPYIGYYDKGYYDSGNKEITEQLSTNFRFITRIPRIGLVTTLTLQMVWMQKERTLYNGGTDTEVWPLYWSGADRIRHPFTEADKENPDFKPLLSETNEARFKPDSYKPYGLLNLRVSKEFTRFVTLSFFANNLADMRPSRFSDNSDIFIQQNPAPFFGLEMQVKL